MHDELTWSDPSPLRLVEHPEQKSASEVNVVAKVTVEVTRADVINDVELVIAPDEVVTQRARYSLTVMCSGVAALTLKAYQGLGLMGWFSGVMRTRYSCSPVCSQTPKRAPEKLPSK